MIAAFVACLYAISGRGTDMSGYTYSDFRQDLSAGRVAGVSIRPNAQVPTGEAPLTTLMSMRSARC